jgi:hypothetical protein
MAGTFRSSNVGGANAATFDITKPAGTTLSDFLLSIVTTNHASGSFTAPSGFTIEGTAQSVATPEGQTGAVHWKVATGSEGATYTWTPNATDASGGALGAWSGIASIAASNVTANSATNAGPVTVTFPTVTTTADNQTVVLLAMLDMTLADTTTWSALPAGYTERAVQSFGFPPYGPVWIADGTKATAGATGAQTAVVTFGGAISSGWVAWTIALTDAVTTGNLAWITA